MNNPLWAVIHDYMADPKHRYPPNVADLARETGVSEQVFSKWKKGPVMPTPAQLARVARGTKLRYETLLAAALEGKHYLPRGEDLDIHLVRASTQQDYSVPDKHLEVLDRMNVGAATTPQHILHLRRESQKIVSEREEAARRRVSALPDSVDDLVAADEQDASISGEQEESETP